MPGLIAALNAQAGIGGPVRVLVAANNCTDGTAALLRLLAPRATRVDLRVVEASLPPELAHAGGARGLAMSAGAGWLREAGLGGGVLISTDADSVPPPGWVAANLRAIAVGAEAVGGEIRLVEDPARPLPPWLRATRARVARYWSAVRDLAHLLDPVLHDPPPRHGDHTGASLAVTLAAYDAAGGVPAVASGEDNALVAAIERNGGRLRHAPDAWTEVSAREEGRASGGMAEEMRRWRRFAEGLEPHLLPDAAHWEAVFRRRRALRESYPGAPGAVAAGIGAAPLPLEEAARASTNAIAFVARADALLPALVPRWVPIGEATMALERLAPRAA